MSQDNLGPNTLFRDQEDPQGYFLLLRQIVEKKGLPFALYHDRHGIFEREALEKPQGLEDQFSGQEPRTHFGRLLKELGIESIPSYSPQAKGRIERLFKTFQDRLGSELRLAGARRLEEFFCFKYYRTAGADQVVAFQGQRMQIHPCHGRQNYYRARVEIQERMDGSLAVNYQGKCLATEPAPPEALVLRVQRKGRLAAQESSIFPPPEAKRKKESSPRKKTLPLKPSPDHPWRKPWEKSQLSPKTFRLTFSLDTNSLNFTALKLPASPASHLTPPHISNSLDMQSASYYTHPTKK